MTFTPEQLEALRAPLNRAHVKSRSQAGRSLSYIEGWHAIAEANRIFGFDGWDRQLITLREIGEARQVDGKWRVAYMATVRINVGSRSEPHPITRDGTGYGSGIDRDLGQAHESALKEAETDAMKRALMTFGNPFGLALYDKDQREVVTDPPSRQQPKATPPVHPDQPLGPAKGDSPGTIAETLIQTLRMARDLDELRLWAIENKAVKDGLPAGYAQDVTLAYNTHLASLKAQMREAAE